MSLSGKQGEDSSNYAPPSYAAPAPQGNAAAYPQPPPPAYTHLPVSQPQQMQQQPQQMQQQPQLVQVQQVLFKAKNPSYGDFTILNQATGQTIFLAKGNFNTKSVLVVPPNQMGVLGTLTKISGANEQFQFHTSFGTLKYLRKPNNPQQLFLEAPAQFGLLEIKGCWSGVEFSVLQNGREMCRIHRIKNTFGRDSYLVDSMGGDLLVTAGITLSLIMSQRSI